MTLNLKYLFLQFSFFFLNTIAFSATHYQKYQCGSLFEHNLNNSIQFNPARELSLNEQKQIGVSQFLFLASHVRMLRTASEKRELGDYDELDFALLINSLRQTNTHFDLSHEIIKYNIQPKILRYIQLGFNLDNAWERWVQEITFLDKSHLELMIEVELLKGQPKTLQTQILNELLKDFLNSRKRQQASHLHSPKRSITFVLMSLVKPMEFFNKHPGSPEIAFIDYINYIGEITGQQLFSGKDLWQFFIQIQSEMKKKLLMKNNDSILIYGSTTNGLLNLQSDIDYYSEIFDAYYLISNSGRVVLKESLPISMGMNSHFDSLNFSSTVSPVSIEIFRDHFIFHVHPRHSSTYSLKELRQLTHQKF